VLLLLLLQALAVKQLLLVEEELAVSDPHPR
jgi:hypothetical protein